MNISDAVIFYDKYTGLMSDEEIQNETGFSVERIRMHRFHRLDQLCWYCANACNDFLCEWVNSCNREYIFKSYPDFVKTKTVKKWMNGKRVEVTYIVECKNYEWDGVSK